MQFPGIKNNIEGNTSHNISFTNLLCSIVQVVSKRRFFSNDWCILVIDNPLKGFKRYDANLVASFHALSLRENIEKMHIESKSED